MINIFQPSLSGNELKNIKKVFSSNWLGRGNAVQEFESEFSKTLKSSKMLSESLKIKFK